jgi:hypothetical protein
LTIIPGLKAEGAMWERMHRKIQTLITHGWVIASPYLSLQFRGPSSAMTLFSGIQCPSQRDSISMIPMSFMRFSNSKNQQFNTSKIQ